jgi:hypothetical protein
LSIASRASLVLPEMTTKWPPPSPSYRRRVDGSAFVPIYRNGVPNARRFARKVTLLDGQSSLPAPLLVGNEPKKRILAMRKRIFALVAFVALVGIALGFGLRKNLLLAEDDSVVREALLHGNAINRSSSLQKELNGGGEGSVTGHPLAGGAPSTEILVQEPVIRADDQGADDQGPAVGESGSTQGSGHNKSESTGSINNHTPSSPDGSASEYGGILPEIRGNIPSNGKSAVGIASQEESWSANNERFEIDNSRKETAKKSFPSEASDRLHEAETDSSRQLQSTLGSLEDGIDSYARSDMQEGERALCRINKACILSSGLLSLPDWMKGRREELHACGLGPYAHHGVDGNAFAGMRVRNVDFDLFQPVRRSRLLEPPSTMTEFLMEFVLPGAFVFDTFGATEVPLPSEVTSTRCYSTPSSTDCTRGFMPERAKFKPGILVQSSVFERPESWEALVVAMLGKAYGDGAHGTMSITDVVAPVGGDNNQNSSATCFRSVLTSELKVKEFPREWFVEASRLFSANSIEKSGSTSSTGATKDGSCSLSITILQRAKTRRLISADALVTKLSELSTATPSGIKIGVQIVSDMGTLSVAKQIETTQYADILVGGTSHSLSNLMFMRANTSVFEVFPFAWQPTLYQELASSMGVRYNKVVAAPQEQEFRACLENELSQLRKQNVISNDEKPTWMAETEQRWQKAVQDFAVTGKSSLVLNTDTSGISNFHTRSCVRRQNLEFNVDEMANAMLREGRRICASK